MAGRRRGVWGVLVVGLVWGCGGAGGSAPGDADTGDAGRTDAAVADEHGDGPPSPDAPADGRAPDDAAGRPDTPLSVDARDAAGDAASDAADGADCADCDAWRPPPPYCVGDVCAAGPDHAPDPRVLGPFAVGVRTEEFTHVDHLGNPRRLKTDIWYPGVPGTGAPEPYRVDPTADAPPEVQALIGDIVIPPLEVAAHADLDVDAAHGPYPLVLFSHGAFGIRYQSVFFTVYLASHGYVVVAPDHEGNTLYDVLLTGYDEAALLTSALDRPVDGRFLLDVFLARTTRDGDAFAGAIDPHRVGTTGHSFGGLLALILGGDDPRVDAVVPFAPMAVILPVYGISVDYYPVPFMLHGGLLDRTLDYESDMLAFYEDAPPPRWLVELARGGHYTYSDICYWDLANLAAAIGFDDGVDALEDGCSPDNIPFADAHVLVRQFAVAFLNLHLRGSVGSAAWLSDAAAATYGDALRYVHDP